MNSGADNGGRTRDTKLGKLVLYQLSYVRPKQNTVIYNLFKDCQEESRKLNSLYIYLSPQALYLPPLRLAIQAFFPRTSGRPGDFSFFGRFCHALQERL